MVLLLAKGHTGLPGAQLQRSPHCFTRSTLCSVLTMPRLSAAGVRSVSSAVRPVWAAPRTKTRKPTAQTTTHPTLLWIDDFEVGLAMYKAMFESLGWKVLTASTGEAGVRLATRNHVDLVVTDYEMPGMDGAAVAASVKAHNPQIPVILFSGSTLVPLRARQLVDACCDKAGSRDELLVTVHSLLEKKRTRSLQPPPVAQASDHGQRTVA